MTNGNGGSSANNLGFQFSAAGAVIMAVIYILQITEISSFLLDPVVTLSIAALAAIGAGLFYTGKRRSSRTM